jgi:DNA mismatch endonuclease, patch repair protein
VDNVSRRRRSEIMARVRGKDTAPEMLVRRLVYSMGYRYRLHDRSLPGTPDLVFRKFRKLIFVHGCFWHGHECPRGSLPSTNIDFWHNKISKNRQRDESSQKQLRKLGWKVLTVWECKMKNKSRLKKRLSQFLEESRAVRNVQSKVFSE